MNNEDRKRIGTMNHPVDPILAYLRNVKSPSNVSRVSLGNVFDWIQRDRELARTTSQLRELLKRGDEKGFRKMKLMLPAVLFAGEFSHASDSGFRKHSGYIVLDFDLPDETTAIALKAKLAVNPHSVGAFISPSGRGVKWVVSTNATDATSHKRCWRKASGYAASHFGCQADELGSEVSRKCFLCNDPSPVLATPTSRFLNDATSESPAVLIGGTRGAGGSGEIGRIGGTRDISPRQRFAVDVECFLPNRPKNNHNGCLWDLARHVKRIEKERGYEFTLPDLDAVIDDWYNRADPKFRPNSLEDYRNEFADMLDSVRCPEGGEGDVLRKAYEQAKTTPRPEFACLAKHSPDLALLLSLIIELAKHNADGELFIAQQPVADLMGRSQRHLSGLIKRLLRTKAIVRVQRHQFNPLRRTGQAAKYRFNGIPAGFDQQFTRKSQSDSNQTH
jgi:hypothetical protein